VNRRDLLKSAAAPALLALKGTGIARGAPRAIVTGLETFYVKVNQRGNWLIPRLQTSAGVTGIGDASQSHDDAATLRFIRQFFEALKGRSIYDVEWFRATVQPAVAGNGRPASMAASALEHCLWDIHGKLLSLPDYELFGGRLRAQIRNYANINRSTDPRTPEGFARMAEKAVAAGFDAVKLAPFDDMPKGLTDGSRIEQFTQRGLECVAAVRRAIGPKRDLLVDAHSRFNVERGMELARSLESMNLFWLEEATPATPIEDLATINRLAKMPTAGGESIRGIEGFYPYIKAEAVDILMPDVKICGGMLELLKIAALAEGARLQVAPHGPASPVGNAAAAQVCAAMPNFLILEFSYGEVPWRAELVDPPETIVDSCLPLSDRPGLGIRLNEKTAAQHAAVIR
jgi:galactonate dehydratase